MILRNPSGHQSVHDQLVDVLGSRLGTEAIINSGSYNSVGIGSVPMTDFETATDELHLDSALLGEATTSADVIKPFGIAISGNATLIFDSNTPNTRQLYRHGT